MMKFSTSFVLWCLSLTQILTKCSSGLNIRELPIRLRILEFDSQSDRLVQVLTSQNSDLVAGDGSSLRNRFILECRSFSGPVVFTYRGDGTPEYRTNANITRNRQNSVYWTFLRFSEFPQSRDTGNYTCQSKTIPNLSNSVYLYVPGTTKAVFIPTDSMNRLKFSGYDRSVRIPCSVVHPDASVQLERILDGNKQTVRPQFHERITYSPKSGFKVPMIMVSPGSDLKFVCRGKFNGRVEEASYQLFSDESFINDAPGGDTEDKAMSKFSDGLISSCTKSSCGINAECIVIDYNSYCVCHEDYTGDAKHRCTRINEHSGQLTVRDQCLSNPCGKFSKCITVNGHPVCSCLENSFGTPPRCTPHKEDFCSNSNDCEWEQYCNQQTRTCDSVCRGSVNFCGINSHCLVINHTPFCECLAGFRGNPYVIKENAGCTEPSSDRNVKTCDLSACGLNAYCKVHRDFPTPLCFCPEGYTGDASTVCFKFRSPENLTVTVRQPELPKKVLCNPTSCGVGAQCRVSNNKIQCVCTSGFQGDPWQKCTSISRDTDIENSRICNICGPNSICKISRNKDKILCECASETVGNPPNCRRVGKNFCRNNLECPIEKTCDRNKCVNPCPWSCSETAICEVFNHTAKCSCPHGFEGDPTISCTKPEIDLKNHPCRINCGPNTICRAVPFEELQQYRDLLRASRQDALYFDMVKANGKLRNGMFSECFCRSSFDGNPYSIAGCHPQTDEESEYPMTIVMQPDPCKPNSPCGANSLCKSFNGKAFCSCDRSSTGQPPNCRLRCHSDKDCMFNETCINKICEDN